MKKSVFLFSFVTAISTMIPAANALEYKRMTIFRATFGGTSKSQIQVEGVTALAANEEVADVFENMNPRASLVCDVKEQVTLLPSLSERIRMIYEAKNCK